MTVHVLSRWNVPDMPRFDVTSQRPFDDGTRPLRTLSPFTLGPVQLYDEMTSQNVENGWQYSKLYPKQFAEGTYWPWAKAGWASRHAVRYPMGKGAKPIFSVWAGEALGYIEARRVIYMPLYSHAVRYWQCGEFKYLQQQLMQHGDIALLDYDAYDHRKLGYSWDDVINDPDRKMGHAFVLAMMLEKVI